MKEIEGAMGGVDRAAKGATLQTGRLGNQFAGLAGQIAGVHPVVGNLAQVLGNFAIGGAVTLGVLGGLALIAVAYDKLTKATREAKKEQDALITSLEKAIHLKALGPGGETVDQVEAARKRAASLALDIAKLEKEVAGPDSGFGRRAMLEKKLNDLYIERQNALNLIAGGQSIINEKTKEAPVHIAKVTKAVKELAFSFEQLRASAEEFWGPMRRFNEQFALPPIVSDMTPGAVDISDSVKIANEVGKGINDAAEKAARDAQMVRDAIWGAGIQSAQIIVNALNIGGGGKGSGLGGAIGSTVGFAVGFSAGGPVGGAIGSLIGNIGGSLLGGLFDSNKKAVDNNTNALRQNTAALLLNNPSGYKTGLSRFNASDIKDLKRVVPSYNSRGGAVASI